MLLTIWAQIFLTKHGRPTINNGENMNTLNRVTVLFAVFTIVACGGGGGGGGSSDNSYGGGNTNTNNPPKINNTVFNISVLENQTSAFTVNAEDPDGNTITYSISGTDSSLFGISMTGVVTFNNAPDFENPSDSGTNNVYEITAMVSDGSLSDSKNFTVTVTDDPSDKQHLHHMMEHT